MKEIWKSIGVFRGVDLTGYYEASNMGGVKRLSRERADDGVLEEKIYSPNPNKAGDLFLILKYNGKNICGTVSQFVMNAFNPEHPPEKNRIRHIDGDKSNCCLDNLEWASQKEICTKGTFTEKQAMALKMKVTPIVQIDMSNGNLVKEYPLREDIKGFTPSTIVMVINKKKYYYKGYIWMYKPDFENATRKEILAIIEQVKKKKETHLRYNCKPVLQLDMEGNLVAEYTSATEAAKAVGCTKQAISLCLVDPQHHVTCRGYIWRYKK